ncbi:hypothetical protein LA664_05875 [Lactobacillus amylolyticus]|nr:hypothetical protein [Lactobacillus amylolyticus]QFY04776.1 hypothetical protein LA664_05875 [Lactobacillus amylolyticus]
MLAAALFKPLLMATIHLPKQQRLNKINNSSRMINLNKQVLLKVKQLTNLLLNQQMTNQMAKPLISKINQLFNLKKQAAQKPKN